MPFVLGQRWVSDAESELGLGTVVALELRTVTLLFPATGENRLYARADAPITRVIFNPGDIITSHEGWQLKVDELIADQGLITYTGTRVDTQQPDILLRETLLDSKLVFSKPQDRFFTGQLDRMERFALRYRARCYQSEQYGKPWSGLRGQRTNLLPHQLNIANDVGRRHAPRVLLADEVGLGKTIEAGMILHQQLLAGSAERVLIVVPETLQHQWLVEMLRRFNLHFALFDDERYRESAHEGGNPFETEQLVLCSLDFVCQNPLRLEQLCAASWDVMVVDEAHHLLWSETAPSAEYRAIEQLSNQIPGVLLLTATPEQLGMESHFARLRLLDPSRFHDFALFLDEQQHYQPVAEAVSSLLTDSPLNNTQLTALSEIIDEEDIEPLLDTANSKRPGHAAARQALITMLMDRHGTSRVLFRNTRHGVKGFPRRELHSLRLPLPEQYQQAMDAFMPASIEQRVRGMLSPEWVYQTTGGEEIADWWEFDPRVDWLINFLASRRNNKIVVICSRAATAIQLEQVLREREGLRAAVFHEGMSIIERDRAAAWFAEESSGAQVLLCSEIGSEGRNFQFANQLVMFDLPFNPDLLEQRIGRLDRIGQAYDISIYLPYLEHTAQALLVRWYHEGLDAFEHTCPTGRTIYDRHYHTLLDFLAFPEKNTDFDALIKQCREQHEALKITLEQGRDRLLEIHSNGGEKSQALAAAIAEQDNDSALVNFAINLFDIIGINQDDRGDNMVVLTPSDNMLVSDFPGIPEDGCTITFAREVALAREDVQFITWEHPIIRNGLDLMLSGTTGSCALSLLNNKTLPVGTLLLELVYVVEARAPKQLQLNRFLPPTPVRMLMDKNGNDLAAQVEFENLNRQLISVNRHTGSKLVGAVQPEVHALLQQAEEKVIVKAQALIDTACSEADEKISAELSRLHALKAVNPNIRDDELAAIEANRLQVLDQLAQASWRLDALRLIIVAHQ